jgi:hypothetical protein
MPKKKATKPKPEVKPEVKPEPKEEIVIDVVQGIEPEPEVSEKSLVGDFLQRMVKEPPPPIDAFAALKEEADLKIIEEATKKMEKAAKRRTFKPITLKITGDLLVHWHTMLEGMRSSLLNRPGVTAAEKAVYSKMPINDDTALDYLLTLHDEEMERNNDIRKAMLVDIPRPERQEPDDELIKNLSRLNQRRQAMTSSNPASMLHDKPLPILPKLGAIAEGEGFTVGGQPMSEADFFRVAASKKPQRPIKKGR